MTSNTPTPARPALDAMAMSEGDEPTPEAILIAAWKLRFNKAFRPEEEAGALMAFLDTIGLCVVSKRSLADMRGAIESARGETLAWLLVIASGRKASIGSIQNTYCPQINALQVDEAIVALKAALARSAP